MAKIRKSGEERKRAAATASATGQLVGLPNSAHAIHPASQPASKYPVNGVHRRPDGRETDFARVSPVVVDVFCAVIPVVVVASSSQLFCARVVVVVPLLLLLLHYDCNRVYFSCSASQQVSRPTSRPTTPHPLERARTHPHRNGAVPCATHTILNGTLQCYYGVSVNPARFFSLIIIRLYR